MGTWKLPNEMASWIDRMAGMLDARNAWRLYPLFIGALFATGRRTVASWLRAGGLSKDYQDFYYFLLSVGCKVQALASRLLDVACERLAPTGRLLFALDDTVTKRFGPHVEGAGIHRNPTPGPADQTFAYGKRPALPGGSPVQRWGAACRWVCGRPIRWHERRAGRRRHCGRSGSSDGIARD
jgi:hypothetical protein